MRSKRAAPERESDEGAWGLEDVVATWSFFVFSSSISMCDGPAPYILRDEASVCLHRRQVARQGKKRLFRMGVVCEVTGVGWGLEEEISCLCLCPTKALPYMMILYFFLPYMMIRLGRCDSFF